MSESIGVNAELHEVIEVLDSIHGDNNELETTLAGLRAAGDSPEDASLLAMDALRMQDQIGIRYKYALGSLAGRNIAPDTASATMRAYVTATYPEGIDDNGERIAGRMHTIFNAIEESMYDPELVQTMSGIDHFERYVNIQPVIPELLPRHSRNTNTRLRIAKGTPDPKRPNLTWFSATDRRALLSSENYLQYEDGSVVASYPLFGCADHESGEGQMIAWSTQEPHKVTVTDAARKKAFISGIRTTDVQGLPIQILGDTQFVRDLREDEAGTLTATVYGGALRFRHIKDREDTYRVNAGQVEIFVPFGRTSFDNAISAGLDDAVRTFEELGIDLAAHPNSDNAVLWEATKAAGGARGSIHDTFRPINTGRDGVPQVNPHPISTGKQN